MRKQNPGDKTAKQQRKQAAAKARRTRRKAKQVELLHKYLRPLVVQLGAAREQIKKLEAQNAARQDIDSVPSSGPTGNSTDQPSGVPAGN